MNENKKKIFYERENKRLISSISKEALQKVFSYSKCELETDFLGFLHIYADLQNLPKNFTIIDVGCCQALQAFYFRKFKRYVGIEPTIPAEYLLAQDNAVYYEGTMQEFVKYLPQLQEQGLDFEKVFAVCSYVPDRQAQQLVSEIFPYHRIVYCDDIISEKYPKGFEPSEEYYVFCKSEKENIKNEQRI